jgi:low affinity Fe/Cu permease
MTFTQRFSRFAHVVSATTGKPWVFLIASASVIAWAATGPIFSFSETWQLVINTGTTIVTFLMVFLIQSTQNRDTAAMHIKLDEIIRALDGAQNRLMQLEDADAETVQKVKEQYRLAAQRAKAGAPDVSGREISQALDGCMGAGVESGAA